MNHCATPCISSTRRTTVADADLGDRAAEHLGVARVLLAAVVADRPAAHVPREPPAPHRDERDEQPRPPRLALVGAAVATIAETSATSTNPAPHVTSTTAALSSWRIRTAVTLIATTTVSSEAPSATSTLSMAAVSRTPPHPSGDRGSVSRPGGSAAPAPCWCR